MRALQILPIALAGCIRSSEPYPVVAVAELQPLGSEISGPLEVLGANNSSPLEGPEKTIAAYRVQLPDDAPRRVRIYADASCDAPRDLVTLSSDLQEIRRVGNETHFFVRVVDASGRRFDIDTETIQAELSLNPSFAFRYIIGKIAVVQAADGDDGSPGAWLACGVFALSP